MLKQVGKGMDSYTAQLLLRESYEQIYGLFNHDAPEATLRPLAVVAMHPKEDVANYSKLYRIMQRYVDHGIRELTGMNFQEFLQQPHELVERWFNIAFEKAKRETPKVDALTRQLAKGVGKMEAP